VNPLPTAHSVLGSGGLPPKLRQTALAALAGNGYDVDSDGHLLPWQAEALGNNLDGPHQERGDRYQKEEATDSDWPNHQAGNRLGNVVRRIHFAPNVDRRGYALARCGMVMERGTRFGRGGAGGTRRVYARAPMTRSTGLSSADPHRSLRPVT
jgi:hypothetical protein